MVEGEQGECAGQGWQQTSQVYIRGWADAGRGYRDSRSLNPVTGGLGQWEGAAMLSYI